MYLPDRAYKPSYFVFTDSMIWDEATWDFEKKNRCFSSNSLPLPQLLPYLRLSYAGYTGECRETTAEMMICYRRVAEIFGRVFVLTEIFILGLLNTSAEGASL